MNPNRGYEFPISAPFRPSVGGDMIFTQNFDNPHPLLRNKKEAILETHGSPMIFLKFWTIYGPFWTIWGDYPQLPCLPPLFRRKIPIIPEFIIFCALVSYFLRKNFRGNAVYLSGVRETTRAPSSARPVDRFVIRNPFPYPDRCLAIPER